MMAVSRNWDGHFFWISNNKSSW